MTASPVCTCSSWNAAAAFALPPANVTGPEKVTVMVRTSDRWADPSLIWMPAIDTGGVTDVTVSVAADVVALPAGLVNTARNWSPLSPAAGVNVYDVLVAPVRFVQVVPPLVLICHWTAAA